MKADRMDIPLNERISKNIRVAKRWSWTYREDVRLHRTHNGVDASHILTGSCVVAAFHVVL